MLTLFFAALLVCQPSPAVAIHAKSPRLVVVPYSGKVDPAPLVDDTVRLADREFELLQLLDYSGKITWRVVPKTAPFKLHHIKAGTSLIGYRTGTKESDAYPVPDGGPAVAIFHQRDGQATLEAWGIAAGGEPVLLIEKLVVCGKVKPPDPEPKPNPDPDPKPTPTPQKIFVSIWSETSTRKPSDAAVLDSIAVRKAGGPDSFRLYDPDVEPTKFAKFKRFVDPVGLPAMVIQNQTTGVVLDAMRMPATEAEALAAIAKWSAK